MTGPEASAVIVSSGCRCVTGADPARSSVLAVGPHGLSWGLPGIDGHTVIAWSDASSVFCSEREGRAVSGPRVAMFGLLGAAARKRVTVGVVQMTGPGGAWTFEVEGMTAAQLRSKIGPWAVERAVPIG